MKLIAGPCVIESKDQLFTTMDSLQNVLKGKEIDFYFKSSCVKDNRTKIGNYRGVGFEEGIALLQEVRKKYNVKITTDFHNESQLMQYGKGVDLIQIPAYLAQQTSLLECAASIGVPIHIKKPQFLDTEDMNILTQKLEDLDFSKKVFVTDRGTSLGYKTLFMDPRHVPQLKADAILVDITHPNKNYPGYTTENSFALAMGYLAAGADGLFLETAPECEKAKCDSGTMLTLNHAHTIINRAYHLWECMR